MPSKRNQCKNAFYCFMQEILPELRREGRVFPNGLQDVVPLATPRWQAMSQKDRAHYENMAKAAKRPQNQGRLDNMGKVIADRKDEEKELEKQNLHETRLARSKWPRGEGVMSTKFYFIGFEYLCEMQDKKYLPCEIGMIEWSMNLGISKTMQKFIDSGPIPLGYRYSCESHSTDTHNIPVKDFELADSNHTRLWIEMENFINPNGDSDEYPPIYCLDADREMVAFCMDWLFVKSDFCHDRNRHGRLDKLYAIEAMVPNLYEHAGATLLMSAAINMLTTSAFDYEPNSVCIWHCEKEVKNCALGTVKKYAYALSDALSSIYNFELTSAHLPTRNEAVSYTRLPAHAFGGSDFEDRRFTVPPRSRPRRQEHSESDEFAFGSRDARYHSNRREDRVEDVFKQPSGTSVASRLAASSGYVAPAAPWSRLTPPVNAATSLPATGGEKFSGRAAPPSSSDLPSPNFTTSQRASQDRPAPVESAGRAPGVQPAESTVLSGSTGASVGQAGAQPVVGLRGGAGSGLRGAAGGGTRGGAGAGTRGGAGARGGRQSSWAPGAISQPQPGGVGRGRGLWAPASGQPAEPSSISQPTRPPPGFGRGIAAQLSGMNLDKTS